MPQAVLLSLDVLLKLAMLPKLPHMPATIVLPDDVQLLFFSVETSGFIHRMAKDFLKRILASSIIAYLQALQSISVALQSTRAHSISVAREFLILDSPPTLPYTAGPPSPFLTCSPPGPTFLRLKPHSCPPLT